MMRSSDNVFNCQWSAYYLSILFETAPQRHSSLRGEWVMPCHVKWSRVVSSRVARLFVVIRRFVLLYSSYFLHCPSTQYRRQAYPVREKERYIMYGYEWMIFLVFFDRMCSDVLQRWLCIINIFWKSVGGAVWNPPVFSTKSTFLIPRGNNQNTHQNTRILYSRATPTF